MQQHIRDDLRGGIKGELLFDDLSRRLYSTDASIFQVLPAGVVVPRDEEDVQTVVRYAAEHKVPLVPRGAGTGMAGECLGSGIVVDLSCHLRGILEIGPDTVRVQPGVVLRDLNNALAPLGRRFAPDPASGSQCTIGGMLANNASGARAFRFGYTRDHVASLRIILDNGEAVAVGKQSRWPAADTPPGRLEDIVFSVATLLEQNAELIRSCQPRTRFNRCGYLMDGVLTPAGAAATGVTDPSLRGVGTPVAAAQAPLPAQYVDLPRLLVGSEGTLGIITEATLRTVPLPGARSFVLLGFGSLEAALRASQRAVAANPVACELIDRRLLSLARGQNGGTGTHVPGAVEAVLLVEFETDAPEEAQQVAEDLSRQIQRSERLAMQPLVATDQEEMDRVWAIRESALPNLYRLRGEGQPIPLVEDIGVPPEQLPEYLRQVQDVLQRHEITAAFLVHAATGQVHTRPFLDLRKPAEVSHLWSLADEIYSLAIDLGGTISTQHGTGIARTPWVARQYGRLYPIFRDLKAIFDPQQLFNPGKIVGSVSGMPMWPLRSAGTPGENAAEQEGKEEPPAASNALRWQPDEMKGEAMTCNGCGHCRTEAPTQRMCPIFRVTHLESATPRVKANLIREVLKGGEEVPPVSSDVVRAVADLCVNCKMCAQECPARVNIPKMMLEAKAANVAEHGLARGDWVLARAETLAWLGSTLAPMANAALRSPTARWFMERLLGISARRRLPSFAEPNFMRRARRRGWTRKPRSRKPRVAYFVDVFANYNDPLIGEAVVAVLHHHDIEVYVPPGQRGCGMAPLAYGDVELAREVAQHNLRALADVAREGCPIVCAEPTAALMLKQDALDLLDDPDAMLVAERTVELTTFLARLHKEGRLKTDLARLELSVGHHVPCHLKALKHPPAGPGLLALIPGLRVRTIDVSCSGMAGTFGMQARNDEVSREAGRSMLEELNRPGVQFGSTECSTCRLQMEDGSGKRTLHPIQYLAFAYGLLPEIAARLREPIGDLTLR